MMFGNLSIIYRGRNMAEESEALGEMAPRKAQSRWATYSER